MVAVAAVAAVHVVPGVHVGTGVVRVPGVHVGLGVTRVPGVDVVAVVHVVPGVHVVTRVVGVPSVHVVTRVIGLGLRHRAVVLVLLMPVHVVARHAHRSSSILVRFRSIPLWGIHRYNRGGADSIPGRMDECAHVALPPRASGFALGEHP